MRVTLAQQQRKVTATMEDSAEGFVPDVRAARWATALSEPLIPTRRRTELDEGMLTLVLEQPTWASAWFSGVISDCIRTLPVEDPWRNLSVNLGEEFDKESAELSISNQGQWGSDDDLEHYVPVRLPNGEPFGGIESWGDLANSNAKDHSIEISTAAVDEDISEESQIMIAFAAHGWRKPFDYSRTLFRQRSQTDRLEAAIYLYESGADALRWAIHRRRMYTGQDDTVPMVSLFTWITTADFIAAGKPWPEADNRQFVEEEQLPAGLWNRIVHGHR